MHEGQKGSIALENPAIYATITKCGFSVIRAQRLMEKTNEKDKIDNGKFLL